MLNALRLTDGFDYSIFTQRTGLSTNTIQPLIDKHIDLGLISAENTKITPTARGKQLLNQMLEDYLP